MIEIRYRLQIFEFVLCLLLPIFGIYRQTPLKGKVQEYLQLRAKCQLKGGWMTVAISGAIFISLDDPISLREVISRCIDLECEGHGTPTPILGGPVGKEGGN